MDFSFLQGQRQSRPATLGCLIKPALLPFTYLIPHSACLITLVPLPVLTLGQAVSCLRGFTLAVPLFLEGSLPKLLLHAISFSLTFPPKCYFLTVLI